MIAFSSGHDSSVVDAIAHDDFYDDALTVTARSETLPTAELERGDALFVLGGLPLEKFAVKLERPIHVLAADVDRTQFDAVACVSTAGLLNIISRFEETVEKDPPRNITVSVSTVDGGFG